MDMSLFIGIIGTILLIVAWAYETIENIRKHKLVIHPHFAFLYIFGNLLLTYYAYVIGSAVFFWLGIILLLAIVCEFAYSLKLRRRRH